MDSTGDLYIVGITASSNYPTNPTSFQPDPISGDDVFLTKLSSISGEIIWSTYFGGSDDEFGPMGLVIDNNDNIIIVGGIHYPRIDDFPSTDGSNIQAGNDMFIAKFGSEGSLIWSTIVGGEADEFPHVLVPGNALFPVDYDTVRDFEFDISVDNDNHIIISSSTDSFNFPVLNGQQAVYNTSNIFVMKYDDIGNKIWSTIIGGSEYDFGHSISIDNDNHIVITGKTASDNYPVTPSAFDTSRNAADGFVTKLDSSGDILWSTYFGGIRDDQVNAVEIDSQNNIILIGYTKSDDLIPINLSQDTSFNGIRDAFIAKFSPQGEVLWGNYIGGEDDDVGTEVVIDSYDNIIVTGITKSTELDMVSPFPFSFGGSKDGLIAKYSSSGELIWNSRSPIITSPNSDISDSDGLSNYAEFLAKTDPFDIDTDDDQMEDGWEVLYHLNATFDDARQDNDQDGLANLQEWLIGTNATNEDTDYDGMPDNWEWDNYLVLTDSDTESDLDNDNLPALWEYENGLSAILYDADDDLDNDGLTNLEEYDLGTSANNKDTDKDGLPDGWEYENELNASDPKDAKYDPDKDGLTNLQEYRYGFDPNNQIQLYIGIILILFVLSLPFIWYLNKRRLDNRAQNTGFPNHRELKFARNAGFSAHHDLIDAKSNGFLTRQVQDMVIAAGYSNVSLMINQWKSVIDQIYKEVGVNEKLAIIETIQRSKSPIDLNEGDPSKTDLFGRVNQFEVRLNQSLSLSQTLTNFFKNAPNEQQFVDLAQDELYKYQEILELAKNYLVEYKQMVVNEYDLKKEWFSPWDQLLTLIQVTEDKLPVELNEIAKVVNCEESHAEELIGLLLMEHSTIGNYDKERKIYTKGVNINSYIEMIKLQLKKGEL
jgi:hypothetical protein